MTPADTDGLVVRDLTPEDHAAALHVRTRSFGPLPSGLESWWRSVQEESIAARRVLGVYDGDRMVGTAKIRPFTQFWGGRPVPMAGVAGVVVLPEFRNRGVASLLLSSLAARARELGDVVSALYPAALTPYRRNGYEIVGTQTRITVETRLLRAINPGPAVPREVGPADVAVLERLQRHHYERTGVNGAKLITRDELRESLEDPDGFCYRTDDGFVLYEWDRGDLVVSALVAPTEDTARTLWSLVGSGTSAATLTHAYLAPDDPLPLLLPEEPRHDLARKHWMLRLLDPAAAVAARGFSSTVRGSATLRLEDPMQPDVAGDWDLTLATGAGALTRTERHATGPDASQSAPVLRMLPGGLAGWYAGTPMAALRTAGLVSGGEPAQDALLDAATGCRPAYLLEYF